MRKGCGTIDPQPFPGWRLGGTTPPTTYPARQIRGKSPRRGGRKLLFDRTCRHAVDHVLDKAEIENDDGYADEDGACRKARKFRLVQIHEPHRDRPVVHGREQQLRQDEVRPRPGEGGQRRVHQNGFGERQNDLQKYLEVGCAVQTRRLIDRGRDGIEEALLHHVPHGRLRRVDEDEPPVVVDKVELRHQKEHRRHCHEGREHAQNQRRLHERLAALELEARHAVRRQNGEQRAEDAAHDGNEQRIAKPLGVVIHLRIGEQLDIVLEAVRLGEKPFERIERSRIGEGR